MMKIKKLAIPLLALVLQGCDSEDINYCPDVEVVANPDYSLWAENSSISFSSDGTNQIAIACHNCYSNTSSDALSTHFKVEQAIDSLVDIIELDVVFPTDNYAYPMVSHEQESNSVSLQEVLSNQILNQSQAMIFVELKGKITEKQYIRDVLDTLMIYRTSPSDFDYFSIDRPVFIRSFEHDTTLINAREVLNEETYKSVKSFVKLSRLHYVKKKKTMLAEIEQAHECGMHMVEFDQRLGLEVVKSLNEYAEDLGLSVAVFTFNESNYQGQVEELASEIDVITVEGDDNASDVVNSVPLFERIRQLITN